MLVYWYSVEEVRQGFLSALKQSTNISNTCLALGTTLDTVSKIRHRRTTIPPKVLEKVHLFKVVEGPHRIIGYVSKDILNWENFLA